jgi:Nucleotide modification associated domain 2
VNLRKSAGHGKLVYAMRVDDIISLNQYCKAHDGDRIDAEPENGVKGRSALISHHFFYFGRNAIDISEIPQQHLDHPFEKRGPGHRCDFSDDFVDDFAKWLKANFKRGVHGQPCMPHSELELPKCSSQVRRKGWGA